MNELASLAVDVPELLLPAPGIDLRKWAVIACDQHTSQRGYWEGVRALVGNAPSTLDLIFPEAYLGDGDEAQRIASIHRHMRDYVERGVLAPPRRAFALVERTTSRGIRRGLVVALDLEQYDHHRRATTLARATEETLESRLPARVRVRDGAPMELPHVLVLIDDPERQVIEPLCERESELPLLYDTPLMSDAGRLRGWAVESAEPIHRVAEALGRLADPDAFRARYGAGDADVLLYAVGDGNHSLAAARQIWDRIRRGLSADEAKVHPARHALVELVNLHDPGLMFEPIHRVVFEVDPVELLHGLPGWFSEQGASSRVEAVGDESSLRARLEELWSQRSVPQAIGYRAGEDAGVIAIDEPPSTLPVGSLERYLDAQIAKYPEASVDYIHGEDVVRSLAAGPRRIGFYLPPMDKRELFRTVILDGALPRKTFSLGHADEKRFYMEARRLTS